MSDPGIVKQVSVMLEEAEKIAREHGVIVGRVSRHKPSRIDEEGGNVVFDVDPETYFTSYEEIAQSGSYLAVVDVKTREIISLRVIEIERQDILAELDLPEFTISLPKPDASGLFTRTRVKAKPLLSYNPSTSVVKAANYVVEPQSPIIKPTRVDTIQYLLGLPTKGVFIGYVTIGERLLFNKPTPLYIPLKTFYQHILVLGTTGSGKTTLLKNLIASIYSCYNYDGDKPSIIIMDPNKDYVHIPLKPLWEPSIGIDWELEERLVIEARKSVRQPSGIVIILPITQYIVNRLIKEESTWVKALRVIARDYFDTVYRGVVEKIGGSIREFDMEVVESSVDGLKLRYAYTRTVINYNGSSEELKLYIIPYGFRFTAMSPREFIELNPFFTQQARDALYRILIKLRDEGIYFNTLREFYDTIIEARLMRKKREPGINLEPRKNRLYELINRFAIHRATLDNIVRQIGSLVDTGFFDIVIPCRDGEEKYLNEPPVKAILEKHEELFNKYPIVLDLEYLQENSPGDPEQSIAISAFRVLNKIFEWKMVKARQRVKTQPVIIVVDEAHRFFPSHGGRRDEYIEHISSMIDRIARLGRARGLGIVFSTHSPKDVHDIILQLTNTKIILRMDKSLIGLLDIPSEYRDFIVKTSDRVGIVKSHALRLGYITFRTPLPLTGHYDLSALSIGG